MSSASTIIKHVFRLTPGSRAITLPDINDKKNIYAFPYRILSNLFSSIFKILETKIWESLPYLLKVSEAYPGEIFFSTTTEEGLASNGGPCVSFLPLYLLRLDTVI